MIKNKGMVHSEHTITRGERRIQLTCATIQQVSVIDDVSGNTSILSLQLNICKGEFMCSMTGY